MTTNETQSGWQAQILDAAGIPASDADTATAILRSVFASDTLTVEATDFEDDTEQGVWLVEVPAFVAALLADGDEVFAANDNGSVSIELP